MASERETSQIQVEIDQFLYYRKSRVGLFVGILVEPLLSKGKIFVDTGEECKIKIKFDCIDLQKLPDARILEFEIKNSFEEKIHLGKLVKQFTAEAITKYTSDEQKSLTF